VDAEAALGVDVDVDVVVDVDVRGSVRRMNTFAPSFIRNSSDICVLPSSPYRTSGTADIPPDVPAAASAAAA
jgi:hypothetical protein